MTFPVDEPVDWPIDGILDLHLFHPRDVKDLVPDYLNECRKRHIFEVRIIHGKGTGALRKTVHAILSRMPEVEKHTLATGGMGGWGATVVSLTPWTD
ncbi:MAG TPA: DNA mismatch repair protein MutS [candidate division Zixibacteria bacterium]|nr:DNA mismatch repair protein MutS [candidate division Zixibacteria bacterium]